MANLPLADSGWAGEIALDVEMVSAACPDCSILLVEADSPNSWDLGPAVSEAVTLGASAVSNSYGAVEDPNDPFGVAYSDGPYVSYFQHDGVLIAVASGDGAFDNQGQPGNDGGLGPSFPATVPSVLSVGGTTLTAFGDAGTRGYLEAAWRFSTSGCSSEFPTPDYQKSIDAGTCAMRANTDVAAAASGIATYVAGAWSPASGTSCASPFVTGLLTRVGLADRPNSFFYDNPASFYDVVKGKNDNGTHCTDVMCNAAVGWDGPTGWGSPNAAALAALATGNADAGTDAGSDGAGDPDAAGQLDADAALDGDAGTSKGEKADTVKGCGCRLVGSAPSGSAPTGASALFAFASLALFRRRKRGGGSLAPTRSRSRSGDMRGNRASSSRQDHPSPRRCFRPVGRPHRAAPAHSRRCSPPNNRF